jgi:nucleoside-diphosphate-sugar epimerase
VTCAAVTGAGGFIGPAVVDALAAAGYEVRALVGPFGEAARSPQRASSIVRADICDARAVGNFVRGAEAVVHLAGPASVAASFEQPQRYVRIHTEGTANVLQACAASSVQTFVYVSSAEVYGRPQRNPVDEDHPLSARSPYGAAKIGAEKLVEAYAHAFGLRTVVLRPFSIFGPHALPRSLIPRIIASARAGRVTVHDLRPVRDYVFVDDFAEAVVCACRFDGSGVFNIGSGQGRSVAEVAASVIEALGVRAEVAEERAAARPGQSEILELIADAARAQATLGWRPRTPFLEALGRMR